MITTFATFDLAHDAGRSAVAGLAGWTFTVHPHGPFAFAVMLTCAETGAPLGWLAEVEEVTEAA
jgi:hypothetical protein